MQRSCKQFDRIHREYFKQQEREARKMLREYFNNN
jgi:hypothetical protein